MTHQYTVPQVRELAQPELDEQHSPEEARRAMSQRDLVAASLLACPNYVGAKRAS